MRYGLSIILFLIGINAYTQDSTLIKSVIHQLNLDQSQVDFEFVSFKEIPNSTNETIVVVPEIIIQEDDYTELNCFILIVNNQTGKITHRYIDRGWTSDAIILEKIEIDNTTYEVLKGILAFGIKGQYYTRSQPNPYSFSDVSLFIKSENTLKKVLNSYDVKKYSAEWDMQCAGESIEYNNTLNVSLNKSNSYHDILVDKEMTQTKSFMAENGECEEERELSIIHTVLKFNGEVYIESDRISTLEVYPNNVETR